MYMYMFFYFQIFTFAQTRQHIIVSKLKLKLSSFILLLECLNERFKNVIINFLEYLVKNRTIFFVIKWKKV